MNKYFLVALLFLLCFPYSSEAYWPSTVGDNLIIANDPLLIESFSFALPGNGGKTFIIYYSDNYGCCYQIIDKFGQPLLPQYERLAPGLSIWSIYSLPHSISDVDNGMLVTWATETAVLGQRIDSLGNRLWGNNGRFLYPMLIPGFNGYDYDICIDGEGGFYLAAVNPEPMDWDDLYLQHIDSEGNLLWGEYGIVVGNVPGSSTRYPKIAPDGNGGCYILFENNMPPYFPEGAIYLQRFDANGNRLWADDLFLIYNASYLKIISDGQGGCIVRAGTEPNVHWRVNSSGQILWRKFFLGYGQGSQLMLGEPGIIYIVFVAYSPGPGYPGRVYLQRVDIETGHNFFPTYNVSGQFGAPISPISLDITPGISSFYNYPYVYTVYVDDTVPIIGNYRFYALKTDSLANSLWSESGIFMSEVGTHSIPYRQAVTDGFGGLTYVFTHETGGNLCDVYAKHVNADGTVGGPLPQVQNTIIALTGNDVVLSWNSMGDSVLYRIYKSAQPYLFPTEPDTVIMDTTYIDVNAVNEGILFYNVRWEP